MNFVLGDYMKNFYSVCNINLVGGVYRGIFSDRGMDKFSAVWLLLSRVFLEFSDL